MRETTTPTTVRTTTETTTTTTTTATTTTTTTTSSPSSSSPVPTTRRSKSNRRRTTLPWVMYDYDQLDYYDETYDYRDQEYPVETSSWQPRDAVLAWQTTPYWAYTQRPDHRRRGNRVKMSTTIDRKFDRRRRTTTQPSWTVEVDPDDGGQHSGHHPGNTSSVASADLLVTMYRLDRIQSLASLVAVLVSMTALLVCLVVFLLFPALRQATSGRCLICLVVCLFLGQVLYLAAALHGFGAFAVVGDVSAQAELCYWLAVATHYVLLAGGFWLNVIAMDAARAASIDSQYDDVKSTAGSCGVLFIAYSLYAWLAPAVIVGGALAAEQFQLSEPLLRPFYGGAGVCWLAGRLGIPLLFALPVAALTVADLVLFAVAACRLPPGSGDIFVGVRWLVAGGLLAVLMALLWAAGLFAAYTEVGEFWYAFIGLHAAIGLFVCLAYAAMPDVLVLIRDSGSVSAHRQHDKPPNYGDDPWRNGRVNGVTQSLSRSISYPVTEYDEIISQETSI